MKRLLAAFAALTLALAAGVCGGCGGRGGEPTFALLEPAAGQTVATRTPTFVWEPCAGASSYTLLIAADAALGETLCRSAALDATQYRLPLALPEDTECHWQVYARVGGEDRPALRARSFRTPAPEVPPDDGGKEDPPPEKTQDEKKLNDLYLPQTALAIPPAAVREIVSRAALEECRGAVRPAVAVLRVDGDGNATDAGGEPLATLAEACEALGGRVMPAFRVETARAAATVADFVWQRNAFDAYVVSSSAELIAAVRGKYPSLRGVLYGERNADRPRPRLRADCRGQYRRGQNPVDRRRRGERNALSPRARDGRLADGGRYRGGPA